MYKIFIKKTYLLLFLLAFGILGYSFANSALAFSGTGAGTVGDPYQITTCVQLQEMNDEKSAFYRIINDIDCSDTVNWNAGEGFLPVGNSTSGQNFTGSLDGNGRIISGLTINRSGTDYNGLFGFMSGSGSVTDLTFSGVSITGRQYTATLAGRSNSTITNVHVTSGAVTGTSDAAGVLGHYVTRTASSISSAATVSGTNYVGGLIGRMNSGSILEYSFATGNVSVSASNFSGGLVGFVWDDDVIVRYSYARGSVTGGAFSTNGGIVGENRGLVEYVYATGSITGGSYMGGISGYNNSGIARYSYWDTQTTGQAGAVGLTSSGGSSTNNTGRTTAQMTSDYSVNLPNFNWVSIWAGDGFHNNGYPYLQVQSFGAVTRPTVQASNVSATPAELTANISWTNGNGTVRMVFMKADNTGTPAPVDETTYAASSAFGGGTQIGATGWYAVYKGTGTSVTATGLAPGTAYRVFVVELDGSAGNELYFTDTATGNPANFTTVAFERPTTPASNVSVGNISGKIGAVSWTSGNGSSRVVFIKEGDSGESAPVDNATYTANSIFGSGTQIGASGWHAVYKGTGSSVSVSNLDSTKNYRVHVVEFNGTVGYELYLTTGASAVITKAIYAGTVIYANSATGNDSTGNGSSGAPYKTVHKAYTEAIDGDTIDLTGTFTWTDAAETTYTTSGFTLAKHNITIRGQKAGDTILQASATDDSANRRIFSISSNMTVTVEKVTMRYGKVSSSFAAACIFNNSGVNLTLRQVDIHNCRNTSTSATGGGAMYVSSATVTIENSSIRNNTSAKNAGAIYVTGSTAEIIITNSTLSGNTADAIATNSYGGAIYALNSAKVWLTNTTITGNTAYRGALAVAGASTFMYLKNTIVSGNTATDATSISLHSITSGTFTSGGYNIIGKHNAAIFTTTTGDWADADGDGTYALHGTADTGTLSLGNTATLDEATGTYFHPLLTDSIGINHGSSDAHVVGGRTINIPASDQRVVSRVGATDIGAFEFTAFDLTPPVVSLTLPANGATVSGTVSLTASASDNVEVGGVSFYVQGVLQGSEVTVAPYTLLWDSTATSSGQKSVLAVARDTANNFATSTAVSITVNNTPTPSAINASVSASTATISWTTAKPGTSRVHYGVFSPLTTATSETNTDASVTTSHERELSGLVPCAVYSYKVVSRSRNGNDVATSTEQSFITSGCSGETPVSTTQKGAIQALTGGSMTLGALTLSVPSSFTATSSEVVFQALALNSNTFVSNVGIPTGKTRAGGIFALKALIDSETLLPTFSEFVTITLSYTAGDIVGIDEQTLSMHRFDGSVWHSLASVLDTGAKTVTATTTAFSDFGIFGSLLPVSSGGVGANAMLWCSGPMAPGWNSSLPDGGCGGGIASSINFVETQSAHSAQDTALTQSAENTASVPQFSFSRDLEEGMEGVDVRALQEFLNQSNFLVAEKGVGSPGEETAYFGALTRLALIRFQEAQGISPARGYFGPITRAKISSMGAVDAIPLAITKTSSNTPTRDLEFGMEGNEVRILQEILIAEGFAISAGATGYFGAQTQSALASFQEAHGVSPALGYFGAITRAHLTKTQ